MTRKWFLGLLGIGAAGQTPVPMSTIKPLRGKPANGECPVCGTMPQYELVRCAHCNAAFWQDTEKP